MKNKSDLQVYDHVKAPCSCVLGFNLTEMQPMTVRCFSIMNRYALNYSFASSAQFVFHSKSDDGRVVHCSFDIFWVIKLSPCTNRVGIVCDLYDGIKLRHDHYHLGLDQIVVNIVDLLKAFGGTRN